MTKAFTRRSLLRAIGLSSVGALAVGGCSASGPPGAPAGLRMLTYDTPEQARPWRAMIAEYQRATGTEVRMDTLPGSGATLYGGKLRAEMMGGNPPDVFRIWGGSLCAPFIRSGNVVDLGGSYSDRDWTSRLRPRNVEDLSSGGATFGVPVYATAIGVWYRTDLFERAGVGVPRTYDELEQANDRLVAAGIVPVLSGGKYGWDTMRTFEYLLETTAGPALHDRLLVGDTSWNRPEVVEAFSLLRRWADRGWFPRGVMGIDPSQKADMLKGGSGAMIFDSQDFESSLAGDEIQRSIGTFIPPTGHSQVRFSGFTQGFMVSSLSPNQDLAIDFLDHLVRPDTQQALENAYPAVDGVPADPDSFPLSALWANWQDEYDSYLIQDQAFPPILANAYFELQSRVLQGDLPPAEAAVAMEAAMGKWRGILR